MSDSDSSNFSGLYCSSLTFLAFPLPKIRFKTAIFKNFQKSFQKSNRLKTSKKSFQNGFKIVLKWFCQNDGQLYTGLSLSGAGGKKRRRERRWISKPRET